MTPHLPRRRSSVLEHLGGADAYVRLADQARRLQRLQQLLEGVLPVHLLPGTRVANLKRGKVVIHAASGAVAVKLRQLAPRLAEGFIQQGQELTEIEVRVQARGSKTSSSVKKTPKILGSNSKRALTSLACGLEEGSPLKAALEKLLRNAR